MPSNLTCFHNRLLGSLFIASLSLPSCVAQDAGVGDPLVESAAREAGADPRDEAAPREPAEADEPAEGGPGAVTQEPGHSDANSEGPDADVTTDGNTDLANPPPPQCGDGTVDAGEECDEGPTNGVVGSECTAICTLDVCGDGHVGPDEDCDDGNRIASDACDSCKEPELPCSCGDGVADGACGEECDDGADNGSVESFCTDQCILAECGDGLQNAGEACDNGAENGTALSDCTAECTILSQSPGAPVCGDNIVDPGEGCDSGHLNGAPGNECTDTCSYNACGDGHRGPDEECDDGNAVDDDSCTMFCLAPARLPKCGDGVLDPDEECDFGAENGAAGSTCTAVCQLDMCGDGHRGPEETCDDGNVIDDDSCPKSCGIEFDAGPQPSLDAGTLDAGDAG